MRANNSFSLLLLRVLLLMLLIGRASPQSQAAAGASASGSATGAASSSAGSGSESSVTPPPPPPKVIELDTMSFDGSIRDGSVWLIEFYAPWCGHCKRFAPTYEEVAKKLHTLPPGEGRPDGKRVMVAKVDGSADRALAARFSVHGFPSFYLIDGWNVYQYEGRRSLDDLVEFATVDYADLEPIPFLNSPFGPMGQIRAAMMYAGTRVIVGYEALVDRGYSKGASAVIMCMIGITTGLVSIIAIGLCMVPKPKED